MMIHEKLETRCLLSSNTFVPHDIVSDLNRGQRPDAADWDADGDKDVLLAHRGKIAWYQNNGDGEFGPLEVITDHDGATDIIAEDIDGDGDFDVLAASGRSSQIAWYENIGNGSFEPKRVIWDNGQHVSSIFAIDVDRDGDIDVLSSEHSIGNTFCGILCTGTVAWYENTDGAGTFGSQQVIARGVAFTGTIDVIGARSVFAADLDGDADIDVISASYNKVAWYENLDGLGSFGPQKIIEIGSRDPRIVRAADLDGDGDMDVLSASPEIAWYENTNGLGAFGNGQVITTRGANSIVASDLDGDGDLDVAQNNSATWYENVNGTDEFVAQPIDAVDTYFMYASDVDEDGNTDLISVSSGRRPRDGARLVWYENRVIGDSNDDGVFNLTDLTMVSQAGKFEDGIPNNATFDEGDWNQDGEFDSGDLVFAFQAGHYVFAAKQTSNDIAVISDWFFTEEDDSNDRLLI